MSSEKFIANVEPVVTAATIAFRPSNIKTANVLAGFPESFGINIDSVSKAEWVNPLCFIGIIIDALRKQQELNLLQERQIADLAEKLSSITARVSVEADEFDRFTEIFKCVTFDSEGECVEEAQHDHDHKPGEVCEKKDDCCDTTAPGAVCACCNSSPCLKQCCTPAEVVKPQ